MAKRHAEPEGAGQALFQFVRHWSRRWNGPEDRKEAERGRDVLVTEAVYALRDRAEVTVNDVAAELAIDQSGASRMLSHAIEQGLLTTSTSLRDARRRTVALTDVGRDFLAAAHQWQDSMFAVLTEDWTLEERNQFHRAMTRLLKRSADLSHER
ncbi:MarR family winged helix-turn-helix transcriptional regulator [Nonomuraea sp. NPDC046570]|uniref:MarR family winged helix-turn-helix transcriptional regulator n=1 Tax=Nonomuraea sp. NPDC046570 TaxID=3155255 RepID=UPI0033E136E1